jgi:laminin alpha 1/2
LCEPGYYSFPDCRPCECDLAGTEQGECRGPICLCSNDGQCRCKKNVRGPKCDSCAENAFSLEAWNPLGCTECFCFGRSAKCQQAANLVWRQTYAPDRKATFEAPFEMYERKHNLHVLK